MSETQGMDLGLVSKGMSTARPKTIHDLSDLHRELANKKKDMEVLLSKDGRNPDGSFVFGSMTEFHSWRVRTIDAIRYVERDIDKVRTASRKFDTAVKLGAGEANAVRASRAKQRQEHMLKLRALAEAGDTKAALIGLLDWLAPKD